MASANPQFFTRLVAKTAVGAANGVASLDANGKILSTVIPAGALGGLTFKGTFDSSTGSYPSSPNNGDLYVVSVAGTISGANLAVGDYIFYSSSLSAWEVIYGPKTTDQLMEGTTNLFFTAARAQTAAVISSLSGSQTNQAPSVSSVNAALALKGNAFTRVKGKYTIASGDVTNGYFLLPNTIQANSLILTVKGAISLNEGSSSSDADADYYLTTNSGSSVTQVNFLNDLASNGADPVIAGNVFFYTYVY